VVVYSGDDDEFEYLYRYVSRERFEPAAPARNARLLDEGTLSVARFSDDGTLEWLDLVFGAGPLDPDHGFEDQGDVLIEARRAADLLGATPMDRPEDIELHPRDGRVFVCLTKNKRRDAEQVDGANPRGRNRHGHVIELLPPPDEDGRADHAAATQRWDVLLLAGDPRASDSGARYHPDVSSDGWLSCPDNAACDPRGRLWIATDGAPSASGCADGLFACDTEGPGRALTRSFLRAPRGAEVCGPCLTPDGRTLFIAIQHPGDGDDGGSSGDASFDTPTTRFPDFSDELPARAAVLAIVREDGGEIGA
jgi:secreted PhoX family phosphatase